MWLSRNKHLNLKLFQLWKNDYIHFQILLCTPRGLNFVSIYAEFAEDLLEQIFDTIGNEPTLFLFRFMSIAVNSFSDIQYS